MKLTAVLFLFVAAVSAKESIKLPKVVVDRVHQFGKPCADKYNIDHSMILKVADGSLPRDDATNNFLLCFTTTAGYMTDDGHLEIEKLSSLVKGHALEQEFRDYLTKCNEVSKETPVATAVAMNACFANAPVVFLF